MQDSAAMDAVSKLEYLSLVNRVCIELENNCGLNDSTLGAGACAVVG